MRALPTNLVRVVALAVACTQAHAQTSFGPSCAGASGVTPELSVIGPVQAGQPWTLEVAAPGGIGLGYLLVGSSSTSASLLGGAPLPLDLGVFFGDPLWDRCALAIDPDFLILPYAFDPTSGGGTWSTNFPGFDDGFVFAQALNVDPDFTTRIAGVSQALIVGSTPSVPNMVPIPPGTFEMGTSAAPGAPYFPAADETLHEVTISQPFWMGRFEVTQAEYLAFNTYNPSWYPGPNRPVEFVTKSDIWAYVQQLDAQERAAGNVPPGFEYRLPTEAEWEYACRAGASAEFAVGDGLELLCTDARIKLSSQSGTSCTSTSDGTIDVGSYPPNAWGLHDMHGNVRELTTDRYQPYATTPVTDPYYPDINGLVVRGGGMQSASNLCRCGDRATWSSPAGKSQGFRIVLAPVLAPSPAP